MEAGWKVKLFCQTPNFAFVTHCSWVTAWQNMVWHKRLYKTEVRPQTIAAIDIVACFLNVSGNQTLNEITDRLWVMHFSNEKVLWVRNNIYNSQRWTTFSWQRHIFLFFFSWKRVFFSRVLLISLCSCF